MRYSALDHVFGVHLHFDFNRSLADPSDPAVATQQLTHVYRRMEAHRVNRNRNARVVCVSHRANGTRLIHDLHDDPAVHVVELVGMLREHELMEGNG
jgi:hypothetical protein